MEFTIACPIDGSVEVGLEDIDNVVLRDADRADITFVCPHCGTEITVAAIVPSFLLAAIEALAEDPDSSALSGLVVVSREDLETDDLRPVEEFAAGIDEDDPRYDAYCEYFRRQLEQVECVDDVLNEIDSHS
ncbi:MAG TPA: hypothetical protein VLA05_03840 [Coriobacteriia bacterium]|nr:hypothetical protein [Coriobacteriia bacterium]